MSSLLTDPNTDEIKSNYSGQFYSHFKVIAFWFMFIFNNAHFQTPPARIQGVWLWTSDKTSLCNCYVTLTALNDSKHTYMDVLAF